MAIQTFNRNECIVQSFSSTRCPVTPTALFSTAQAPNVQGILLAYNIFIKGLRVYTEIRSVDAPPFPEDLIEDSDGERTRKLLDLEWNSPRKEMSIFLKKGSQWNRFGNMSLMNPLGYPYRYYNLQDLLSDNLPFEIDSKTQIGVCFVNAGHGLLTGQDKVMIYGNVIHEYIFEID